MCRYVCWYVYIHACVYICGCHIVKSHTRYSFPRDFPRLHSKIPCLFRQGSVTVNARNCLRRQGISVEGQESHGEGQQYLMWSTAVCALPFLPHSCLPTSSSQLTHLPPAARPSLLALSSLLIHDQRPSSHTPFTAFSPAPPHPPSARSLTLNITRPNSLRTLWIILLNPAVHL